MLGPDATQWRAQRRKERAGTRVIVPPPLWKPRSVGEACASPHQHPPRTRHPLATDGYSVPRERDEFPIAFADDGSVVVNFGIVAGREATQAELARLALAFRGAGAGAEMTIPAERHQDYEFEGVVHQVRVTLPGSPPEWVEAICAAWAVELR